MMNTDKVRDCVGTGELFEVVNEYSCVVGNEGEVGLPIHVEGRI